MDIKEYFSTHFYHKIKSILFLFLIFYLPFVEYSSIVKPIKVGQELYLVSIVFLWLIIESISFFRTRIFSLNFIDLSFAVFLFYTIIHYYCFSYYSVYNNQFWVFLSYFILFYLFQSVYKNENKITLFVIFNYTVILICVFCFVESLISILQEFGYLIPKNQVYKTTGTFLNPNYLGIYMMIGILFIIYSLLFIVEEVEYQLILIGAIVPIFCLLILTQSRASWFSLIIGIVVLVFTSPECIMFLRRNKAKSIVIIVAFVLSGFMSLYLLSSYDTDSLDGRALIRKITISKIEEKPLLGYGTGNFSSIYNFTKAKYFEETQRSWDEVKVSDYGYEVFNDYIQIVFEIGILGLTLLGLIVVFVLNNINLCNKTRLALAILFSVFSLAIFTTTIYNPNIMILAVWALSILVVYGKNRNVLITFRNSLIIKSVALFSLLLGFTGTMLFYKKTKLFTDYKATQNINQTINYNIINKELKYIKDEPYVQFRQGLETYYSGNIKKGIAIMENSVKKNPFVEANEILCNIYLQQEDTIKAEKLLKTNVNIEPFKFKYRNNLLIFYSEQKQYEKELAVAKEIVQLPVKIPSEEVDMYKKKANSVLKKLQKPKF